VTVEQQELFDLALLNCLDSGDTQFGLGPTALQHLVGRYGFSIRDPEQITRRLEYMADPQIEYVRPVDKGNFNTANRSWRITAKGTNHLRERGY
jgi:hypothetical protein